MGDIPRDDPRKVGGHFEPTIFLLTWVHMMSTEMGGVSMGKRQQTQKEEP